MAPQGFEYDPKEEKLNILTHAIGIVFAVLGTVLLLIKSMSLNNTLAVIGSLVFGLSMITLYSASTIYHQSSSAKRPYFRVFDHASIYILIAGTYTPFTLVSLPNNLGWIMFGVTWGLAIIGIVLKLFYTGRFNLISTLMYLIMGWNIVFAIMPLIDSIGLSGFWWLLAGGIIYSLGAVFYLFDNIKYMHAVFHLFVLAGSFCHFIAVYNYVLV